MMLRLVLVKEMPKTATEVAPLGRLLTVTLLNGVIEHMQRVYYVQLRGYLNMILVTRPDLITNCYMYQDSEWNRKNDKKED